MPARRNPDGTLRRGSSNSNSRGGSTARRARKLWLLEQYGDGVTCLCFSCGDELIYETLQADRIIPGCLGGGYARGNIRPCCGPCNIRSGNAVKALIRAKVPKRTILRLCRLGEL
jgi:5-methylcytosine-specific restriction endonuclease McrA